MKHALIALLALLVGTSAFADTTCTIGEYASMADIPTTGQVVPVWGNLITTQTIPVTASSGQSAALNAATRFVRISCKALTHFKISVAEANPNPMATTTDDQWVGANSPEGFAAAGGQKIAFIEGSE